MSEPDSEQPTGAPPKSSSLGYFGVLFALALVAVSAGWFAADQLQMPQKAASFSKDVLAKKSQSDVGNSDKASASDCDAAAGNPKSATIILDPIIVALQKSDNAFMRIELAIIPNEDADISSKEELLRIGSDIAAFTQTLTLQQISGPTGHLHFREDILDRVRLVTNGKVKDLLILSMVAE